jgi:hypothetical protein
MPPEGIIHTAKYYTEDSAPLVGGSIGGGGGVGGKSRDLEEIRLA